MKLIITDIENFSIPIEGDHKIIKPQGNIKHCIGCFGCWAKTPGKCVLLDGYEETGRDMGKCTELIIVSGCHYGSVSPFVKMIQDRAISYTHADFVIRKGEMHHKRRYKNIITLSSHLYGENITTIEKETALELLKANAENYDGLVKDVYFYQFVEDLGDVVL
jgi:multimeric flavodoxin WrbA